jgi:hypothetical protein
MPKQSTIYDVATGRIEEPPAAPNVQRARREQLATTVTLLGTTCIVLGAAIGYSAGYLAGLREKEQG